jgi:hypothetical protein
MRRIKTGTAISMAGALLATTLLATGAAAQDDDVMELQFMEVPNIECTHEPRVLDEMLELFGEPAAAGAGEAASLERNDAAMGQETMLPLGEPADEATAQAAQDAVHGLVSCFNAGDMLAGWGGVTDEFLTSQMDLSIFDEDFVAQIEAGPEPLAEEFHTRVIDFGDTLVHEDGRVGVIFHYHGPSAPGEGIEGVETDLFIVRNVDGAWKLDEVIENLESEHGPEGVAAE